MGDQPLIGVDDMETPYWALGYQKVAEAGLGEVAAAVPRTMARVVRWAWRAAPRLTVLAGVLQLATGFIQAFGLLATADVFTRLLAAGRHPSGSCRPCPRSPSSSAPTRCAGCSTRPRGR